MLFEVYWSSINYRKEKFTPIVKEAPPEDSFVIITSTHQEAAVEHWIKDESIPVQYRMEEPITNIIHLDNGRSLRLYILGNGPKLTPSVYKEKIKTVLIAPIGAADQLELAI